MKKVLLFASVIMISGMMTSCKKDWTCTCTLTETGPGVSNTSTASITINAKKKDAEEACGNYEYTISSGSYTDTQTCKID